MQPQVPTSADDGACHCRSAKDFTLTDGLWVHLQCGKPTAAYLDAMFRLALEGGDQHVGQPD